MAGQDKRGNPEKTEGIALRQSLVRFTRPMNPRKWGSVKRLALVHGLSLLLPIYIVNEFPKSGGTWISKMVARALDVPFHDGQIPRFERSLIKGHFMHKGGMRNPILVWRDGRDVMVSYYYHSYFKFVDYPFNHEYVDVMRRLYPFDDYNDLQTNLPHFIEQQFARVLSPMFTWADFVEHWWDKPNSIHVRYEDMRANPVSELCRIVREVSGTPLDRDIARKIVDEQSIQRMRAKSKAGTGQYNFVRKGAIGDWVNHLTPEASKIFEHYAGHALDIAGYPRDPRLANGKPRTS